MAGIPFGVALLALWAASRARPPGGRPALRPLVRAWGERLGELLERPEAAGDPALRALAREAARWQAAAEREMARLAASGIRILGPGELPEGFLDLPDPPGWLFVEGDPGVLARRPAAAVVGTRRPSPEGLRAARALVEAIARVPGALLVSGLAPGIDREAHQAALALGIPQVAFLGHGLGRSTDPEARALRARIVAGGGAVASERFPEEGWSRWTFLSRNRLIAALAGLVLPVEGSSSGGTAHTVRLARRLGRPVWAVRWPGAGGLARILEGEGIPALDPFSPADLRRLAEALAGLSPPPRRGPIRLDL